MAKEGHGVVKEAQRGAILGVLIAFRRDFWRKSTVIAPRAENRAESPGICSEKTAPAPPRQAFAAKRRPPRRAPGICGQYPTRRAHRSSPRAGICGEKTAPEPRTR